MDNKHIDYPPMQEIIDLIADPFMLIDRNHQIVAANQRYCAHYKVDPEDIVGRYCYEVSHHAQVPSDQHREHCPMQDVIGHHKTVHVVHIHYDKDGDEERVQLMSQPIRGADGNIAYMGESIISLHDRDHKQCILVGRSKPLNSLMLTLNRIASTSTTVLLG